MQQSVDGKEIDSDSIRTSRHKEICVIERSIDNKASPPIHHSDERILGGQQPSLGTNPNDAVEVIWFQKDGIQSIITKYLGTKELRSLITVIATKACNSFAAIWEHSDEDEYNDMDKNDNEKSEKLYNKEEHYNGTGQPIMFKEVDWNIKRKEEYEDKFH